MIFCTSVTFQKGYPKPNYFVLLPKRGVNNYSSAAVSLVSNIRSHFQDYYHWVKVPLVFSFNFCCDYYFFFFFFFFFFEVCAFES